MKETIGDRIKTVREKNNLSTIAFAKNLEISQPSLTGLENNKSEPRAKTIIALIEKFGVDPNWLLTGKATHVIQNPLALKIGQLADSLPYEIQNLLLTLVEREVQLENILTNEKNNSISRTPHILGK
ncbi:Helix-turn-helix domain protein [anaerobic digester metagenome]